MALTKPHGALKMCIKLSIASQRSVPDWLPPLIVEDRDVKVAHVATDIEGARTSRAHVMTIRLRSSKVVHRRVTYEDLMVESACPEYIHPEIAAFCAENRLLEHVDNAARRAREHSKI